MSASPIQTDFVIFGAGIAGLWTLNHLRKLGYSAILLETDSIGCGQTVAAQGIIHSGLKYAFAGKINKLAQSISAMPDLWRDALAGRHKVNISGARVLTDSQFLLVPGGFMGGLVKLVTQKALGNGVRECKPEDWPQEIKDTGFKGFVIYMDEPVLDVPSLLRTLAEPYRDAIRKVEWDNVRFETNDQGLAHIAINGQRIEAQRYLFTAAGSNHEIARRLGHDTGLETQKRPLLQGMMKNAPYKLYAHLVGSSDKPVATITTHEMPDGTLVWYIGGGAAERPDDAPAQEVYKAIRKGFAKYLPQLDLARFEWATLPINRIEGKSATQGWMPDTPTIHYAGNALYCWPTKLTFAPLLAKMLEDAFSDLKSQHAMPDVSFLPAAEYTQTPWEKAQWTQDD